MKNSKKINIYLKNALIYTSFRSVINERPLEVQQARVEVLNSSAERMSAVGSTDAADVFF